MPPRDDGNENDGDGEDTSTLETPLCGNDGLNQNEPSRDEQSPLPFVVHGDFRLAWAPPKSPSSSIQATYEASGYFPSLDSMSTFPLASAASPRRVIPATDPADSRNIKIRHHSRCSPMQFFLFLNCTAIATVLQRPGLVTIKRVRRKQNPSTRIILSRSATVSHASLFSGS